jgi:hypothetical protein
MNPVAILIEVDKGRVTGPSFSEEKQDRNHGGDKSELHLQGRQFEVWIGRTERAECVFAESLKFLGRLRGIKRKHGAVRTVATIMAESPFLDQLIVFGAWPGKVDLDSSELLLHLGAFEPMAHGNPLDEVSLSGLPCSRAQSADRIGNRLSKSPQPFSRQMGV